ncbi:hypothetical protein DENIS_2934 [Desulfonema ishimotonii]|uniref:YhdP central domain-containing protein n=1 Tax=Desulfonema ishimotonii TaxID=45657 RepID=A0A401FYC6_9BACT|nr:AsmA-like C-terminal domain-containing protein [Desulfonema ishimotonii]GBC61971.1 hypothetical protein DENIS_2934 [Desulfonema ishimotonii]
MKKRWKTCLRKLGILACVFLVIVVGLLVWLRIALPSLSFLNPYIRTALSRFEPEFRIEYDEIRLAWSVRQMLPGVRIGHIRIFKEHHGLIARSPETLLLFSIPGLIAGKPEPVEIEILRPEITLPAPGETPVPPPAPAPKPEFHRRITDALFRVPALAERFSGFRQLHIRDAVVTVASASAPVRIAAVTFDIRHARAGLTIRARTEYTFREAETRLEARLRYPSDNSPSGIRLTASGLSPSFFGTFFPLPEVLRSGRFSVRGLAHARFSPSGDISVDPFELSAEEGTLVAPHYWEAPLAIETLQARGRITENLSQLELESLRLDLGDPVFSASGRIRLLGELPDLDLEVRADGLKIAEAHRYWPIRLAAPARRWIRDHFSAGAVSGATLSLRLRPEDLRMPQLPAHILSARVPFEGVILDYHPPLGELREARGVAEFSAHAIDIRGTEGAVYHSAAESIRVGITGLAAHRPEMTISAKVHGPPDDLMRAVDALTRNTEYPVRITTGRAETRLAFEFPLTGFTPEKFRYRAEADIRDMGISDFLGCRISEKRLKVRLENDALTVQGAQGRVKNRKVLEKPLPLKKIALRGRLLHHPPGLAVEKFSCGLGGPVITADGHVKIRDGLPEIAMNIGADRLTLEQAMGEWPRTLAPAAREWVGAHLRAGEVTDAKVRISIGPDDLRSGKLPKTAIEALVPFKNVVADYFPPLPELRGAEGVATFFSDAIDIGVRGGQIADTRLATGTLAITGLGGHSAPRVTIDANFQGPLGDILEVGKRLGKGYTGPPIENGVATTRLTLGFPLTPSLSADALQISVTADARDIRVRDFYGLDLRNGQLRASLTGQRFEADGSVQAGRTTVGIRFESSPPPSGIREDVIHLSAPLNLRNLPDFGLPALPPLIKGNAGAEAVVSISPDRTAIEVKADLGRVEIGRIKRPGEAAFLRFDLDIAGENTIRVSGIRLSGKGLNVSGSGQIDTAPVLMADFSFDRLKWGDTEAGLFVAYSGSNRQLGVELRGKRLDLGPLLAEFSPAPKPPAPPAGATPQRQPSSPAEASDATFTAKLDEVVLLNGDRLTSAEGRCRWQNGSLTAANFDAVLQKKKRVHLSLTPQADRTRLSVEADNAGALLTGLNICPYIRGGTLDLKAEFAGGLPLKHPAEGRLRIREFTAINAPTLVQLLSAASFVSVLGQLRSGGINFRSLRASFRYADKKLTVSEGRTEGLSLGLTAEGAYDTGAGTVDFKGIVVPFNILNRVVRSIPVVGRLITGKGIIATNYTITGPHDQPNISIQPLSTLAIGSLKDVFSQFEFKTEPGRPDIQKEKIK